MKHIGLISAAFRKRQIFACVLLPAALSLAHASPMPGASSVTIEQLSWRLVDLEPEDGIDPWLRVQQGRVFYDNGSRLDQGVDASPLPVIEAGDGDGMSEATVAPDELRAMARYVGSLRASDFRFVDDRLSLSETAYVSFDRERQNMGNSGMQLSLSPKTAVVIEGKAHLRSFADASIGARTDDLMPLDGPYTLDVVSESQIAAYSRFFGDGDNFVHHVTKATSQLKDGVSSGVDIDEELIDFVFSFRNESDDEADGSMHFSLRSTTTMSLTVPEPSTWLTFGLGLAGLCAARRRASLENA